MAYVYQVSFEIDREKCGSLLIGSPLQSVLGFLRTRLPELEGFISSNMLYSLGSGDHVSVLVQTIWEHYADLSELRDMQAVEGKILEEFGDTKEINLLSREFAEVG